jgi:type II secretory pathway pseudopilin PulG
VRWILVDVVLALLALAALAVLLLGLWRKVKRLSRTVSDAGEQIGQATEGLAAAQGAGPLGALPARPDVAGRSPATPR